ncbi:flagellar hook-length control protein FliK [Roseovarius aquimarinus]|uniref:Flagellar hook-length control protein FliK n=1 Tax=Roseovarius aquimarinus TaxID=1229156 RepID=A0ABW7IAG9_9RHOB
MLAFMTTDLRPTASPGTAAASASRAGEGQAGAADFQAVLTQLEAERGTESRETEVVAAAPDGDTVETVQGGAEVDDSEVAPVEAGDGSEVIAIPAPFGLSPQTDGAKADLSREISEQSAAENDPDPLADVASVTSGHVSIDPPAGDVPADAGVVDVILKGAVSSREAPLMGPQRARSPEAHIWRSGGVVSGGTLSQSAPLTVSAPALIGDGAAAVPATQGGEANGSGGSLAQAAHAEPGRPLAINSATAPRFEEMRPAPVAIFSGKEGAIPVEAADPLRAGSDAAPVSDAPPRAAGDLRHAGIAHTPQAARHVAVQIAHAAAEGRERSIDVLLNPSELGRVRVSVTQGEAGLVVAVAAERAETLDLMRRNADLLSRCFEEMSAGGASFSFSREGGAADRQAAEPSAPVLVIHEADGKAAPSNGLMLLADRLDIRL